MGLQYKENANRLLDLLPEGVAVPSKWLEVHGFSRQLVRKYRLKGRLAPLGRGAYYRPQTELSLEGLLLGLQKFTDQSEVHLGGLSALSRAGHIQYLPLASSAQLEIWSTERLPSWVQSIRLKEGTLVHRRTRLFQPGTEQLGLTEWPTKIRDWMVRISGPERAILEMLEEVDGMEASFIHAAQVFETLVGLKPRVAAGLLKACRSVKAKRLFFFLSEHFDHAWAKKIPRHEFELGRGKRQIVKGGRFDKDFGITVPRNFHD